MFNFNVLLAVALLWDIKAFAICLNVPSHVWVCCHNFHDDFLFSVVVVIERSFSLEAFLLRHEGRQEGMVQEIFEVQVLCFHLLISAGNTGLVFFFDLFSFGVVTMQEIIQSVDVWKLEHSWQLKHKNVLVINRVDVKDFLQNDLD